MSEDTKETQDTATPDPEAAIAAQEGALDNELVDAGFPRIEVKEWSFEQKLKNLREGVRKAAANEAKGLPPPDFDYEKLARNIVAIKDEEAKERAKAETPPEPEPIGEQKIVHPSVATHPAQTLADGQTEPIVNVPHEVDADRQLPQFAKSHFRPSYNTLLFAPTGLAADVCSMQPDTVKAFRKWNDQVHLLGCIRADKAGGYERAVKSSNLYRSWAEAQGQATALGEAIKALDLTDTSSWIPTGFSADLINRVRLALRVGSLFDEIPMPTSPYKLPTEGSSPTAYVVAENTASTGQTAMTGSEPGSGAVTFTAVKFGVRTLFSDEVSEDSIVPILGLVQDNITFALADGIEIATLNGDGATAHFDTGTTWAATAAHSAWNGLRHFWDAQTSAAEVDCNTFSTDNLLAIRGGMGKFGVNPRELAWICSMWSYIQLLKLDEAQTVDKYGPRAVIHEGELAQYLGSPVVVSENLSESLNAVGIYDNSTTDYTAILCVHRPSVKYGRRSSRVESDRIIEYGQTQVVGTVRIDLQPMWAAASNNIVGCGYKVPKT